MRHVILYTDEDGYWIAEVPSLPGCGSDGATKAEALERVKEAIQVWIEAAREHGEPIPPDEYPNLEVALVDVA
ncbi:MAG: type II toxin-antitoxin system HicB family antitoxin [Anaerolineae bacterium]|nr:type II toxin-antitoxin system HicB family antitoxin [Anaerolineae bacterium]